MKELQRTHVDSKFPQIRVELTREAQTRCDTRHDEGDKVVKVSIGRR